MKRKTVLAYLLGCATLPIVVSVLSLAAAGWLYFAVPVDAGRGNDGSTASAAIVVEAENELDAVNAEYTWLMTRRPADVVLAQSLVFEGDRVYDVFDLQTPDGESYRLHFDITNAYGEW